MVRGKRQTILFIPKTGSQASLHFISVCAVVIRDVWGLYCVYLKWTLYLISVSLDHCAQKYVDKTEMKTRTADIYKYKKIEE